MALTERLTGTEALNIVGQMLRGYANGGAAAGKSYIGALAEVIGYYPRCVALRAGDLLTGVPRDCKFLPTPADVIAWCEREKSALQDTVDRDDHYRAQAREMERRAEEQKRLADARKARPSLDELRAKYGPNWGIGQADDANDRALHSAASERMRQTNETLLMREYADAGEDPHEAASGLMVSRELRDRMAEIDAGRRAVRMRHAEKLGAEADRLAKSETAE